jgi:hypothetical protein
MNDIDVRRFVDINIKQHVETQISGTRDTLVLYTHEGTLGKISGNTTDTISDKEILASWAAANAAYPTATFPDTNVYLSMYFQNSGARVVVIEGVDYTKLTVDMLKSLDNKFILIGLCSAKMNVELAYDALKKLATARETDNDIYGVNEKIIFARTETTTDTSTVSNFASKYSKVYGAEMTMAAYLSGIDVYGVSTVNDYMYTAESIDEEVLTDTLYETLTLNNMNVDTYFAGNVRNLGGNLKNGADLTNSYVRIILHQTLTERLLELLVTKIKNVDGIGKIYATISKELENYRACGYLSTDKVWTDKTMTVTVNGKQYTIIEEGTPLTNGYYVQVLPMSALTEADRAARKAPPIYVIIADQYGIRAITVNGEII